MTTAGQERWAPGLGRSVELYLNPRAERDGAYDAAKRAILNDKALDVARSAISAWPGYRPTPLRPLPGLARATGVAAVHYKDEAERFGLGSFKALGGAYAVARLLCREVGARTGEAAPTVDQIGAGPYRDIVSGITVCCATDGNHGRSVAWGAQAFGCRCVIFIHATVSEARKQAIERFGARVVRTPGNYDDSVREAQATAAREGWFVVSDTSYEGYTEIPKDVMQGYEVMAAEAYEQLGDAPPTHAFLQTGVGGLAAAVTAYAWRRLGNRRPVTVLADPVRSACWVESLKAGRPTAIHGDLDTVMAGLACGEVSLLAWKILRTGADAVVAIDDEAALDGMCLLADGRLGDPPIVAGESAVAGLAALLAVAADPDARARLGLAPESRVLLFGTEGDTDPALYREIVGDSGDAVRRGMA
jgi:diaminopropionate ammonia-lyase